MKKTFTINTLPQLYKMSRRSCTRFILLCLLLPLGAMFFSAKIYGQIGLPSTVAVTENFDAMGTGTSTPSANWRVQRNATPTWAGGTTTPTVPAMQVASSGAPSAGGFYNWGTSTTERALGVMTSGGFASPNSVMAWYRNTNPSNLVSLTIAYDLERYRVNTVAASVQFFYSTDGTTWTAVTAGDIAAASLPTGTSAYTFGTPLIISKAGISITGLNLLPNANIYLRWNIVTGGANSQGLGLDNVSVVAGFAAPAFILKDNTLSSFNYVVGAGPSASQIDSITATNLPTASGNIRITAPANFQVSADNTTWVSSFDIPYTSNNLARTRFYVRLAAGLSVNSYSGNVVVSNLTDPGTPVNEPVACSGTVGPYFDALSDVVAVAASESATIPSTQNANAPLTIGTGAQVWSFTIRDGGGSPDVDNLPTIVNSIILKGWSIIGNSVSSWPQAIKTVSLFDGATLVSTGVVTRVVDTCFITFSGMSLTVTDNTNKTLTMRLSLNCGIGGSNFDGDDFVFTLINANFTTAGSATSSQKTSFAAATSANGSNVITVVATKLNFTVQPTTVGVNASISPAVIVTATDACGNKDLNYVGTINITSTGTLTSAQSEAAISGVATFPGVSFSAAGTSLTLTAAAVGLTSVVSNPFDVTTTTLLNPGDLMIVGYDTYAVGTGGPDKLSIANLVPLLPGTEFSIANMVYEYTAAANVATGRWYSGNGTLSETPPYYTIRYNGAANLAKGSVICIFIPASGTINPATDISVNGTVSSDFSIPVFPPPLNSVQFSSTLPDAFFLMQGTFSADDAVTEAPNVFKTFSGTVFGAIQTRGSFQSFNVAGNNGGSRISRVFPTLACISISQPTLSGELYGYYKSTALGGLHTGSQHDIIKAIANVLSNWTTGNGGAGTDNLATDNTCTNNFTVTGNISYGYWTPSATSKDWFDCSNWDNFAVPDQTINVTIDGTALSDCQIDANTSAKAAQFGYKGDAKSVTITGRKLIIENTGALINRLDIAANMTINTPNGLDMSDGTAAIDGTINIKGNWANNYNDGFDPGQSTINFNGTTAQTITVPDGETFYNFTNSNTVAAGVAMTNNNANFTVNNVFSLSNGILTMNTNTLTLNGTATGTGTITGSNTSNLIIGGTTGGAFGTLYFTAGSRLLNNITLNRTGAGATATLGTDLAINTLATISAGTLNAQTNSFSGAGSLTMTGGELQVGRAGVTSPELSGTYTLTAGVVNFTGSGSQTVRAVNYYDLTSTSTGARVMANAGTIGIANTFTKGTNAYTFTGSTVDYNGTAANQNITAFTAAVAPGSTYNNLTLSNSTNAVTSKTLLASTDVEGDLTLNNSISLKLGASYLNLKSTATKTARVAPVPGTVSIDYSLGAGRFVVERYYPGRRKWRLVTAPVTVDNSKTIFNSWQVGGASPVGSGTYVTGPSPTGAGGNGLDVSPQNNYSLKTYNNITNVWDGVANTTSTSSLISGTAGGAGSPDNKGFFMFVRGDRTAANVNAFNPIGAVNETTLRDTGKIQTQLYDFDGNATVGQFAVVGNPYASPVDFGSASMGKAGIANKFYAWDPNINGTNGVGGYVIVDMAGPTVTTVPVGQSGVSQTQIIQSKQAILIETNGASPKLTFNEAAKSSVNNLNLFRPAPSPLASVAINLHSTTAEGEFVLADGVLAQFGNDFADGLDHLDSRKFTNINETFSILHSGNYYMLERRKPVRANDTIFLSLNRARQLPYRFNVMLNNMAGTRLAAYLVDTYLNRRVPVHMDGSTWVDFTVNNAASAASNRFYIVFKKAFRFSTVHAHTVQNDVSIQWGIETETEMNRYEVERSADGETFEAVGTVNATEVKTGIIDYSLLDIHPAPGIYYYRIKGISQYGTIDYSDAVKVKVTRASSEMYVYPNPVTGGKVNLQMGALAAGIYAIRIVNNAGQTVLSRQIIHAAGTVTESIAYPASITAGTYQLEATGSDKKKHAATIMISK